MQRRLVYGSGRSALATNRPTGASALVWQAQDGQPPE
jgi:hypothetical protein